MDVNVALRNRSHNTATFPKATVKSAEPLLLVMAYKSGRSLRNTAILLFAAIGIPEIPMVAPRVSRTRIVTVVSTKLGLTMATAVTKFVSSQMRVLLVD